MTKPHTHSFRCTPETSERLKAGAKAAGLTQGDYIAQLLDRLDELDQPAENPTAEDVLRSTAEANGVDPDLAVEAVAGSIAVTRGEPTPGELHIDLAERVDQLARQLTDRADRIDRRLTDRADRADRRIARLIERVDELEQRTLPPPEEYRPPVRPVPPAPCVCGAPTTTPGSFTGPTDRATFRWPAPRSTPLQVLDGGQPGAPSVAPKSTREPLDTDVAAQTGTPQGWWVETDGAMP